ncbi:MAG: FtsX-like permease family protein, partial [Bryobacteraceae bacterium]
EGRKAATGEEAAFDADLRYISPAYFSALQIPVIQGRVFNDGDASGTEPVAVINQSMARTFWPGGNPIGEHIWIGKPMGPTAAEPAPRRVIGIVQDIHEKSIAQPPVETMYVPSAQANGSMSSVYFLVRTSRDAASMTATVRTALRDLAPDQPLGAVQSLDQLVDKSLQDRYFQTTLLSLFGGMALLIAAVGVYGVVSYSVTTRTREIGVRMALGAAPADVLRMVIGQGLRLATAGVVLGLAASFALTRLISGELYGTTATDPVTFAAVTIVLLAMAVTACWIPARRATRVDPMIALRYE